MIRRLILYKGPMGYNTITKTAAISPLISTVAGGLGGAGLGYVLAKMIHGGKSREHTWKYLLGGGALGALAGYGLSDSPEEIAAAEQQLQAEAKAKAAAQAQKKRDEERTRRAKNALASAGMLIAENPMSALNIAYTGRNMLRTAMHKPVNYGSPNHPAAVKAWKKDLGRSLGWGVVRGAVAPFVDRELRKVFTYDDGLKQ